MDINPTDLRYFFEVAQALNISRAAERLNIGQPAVSQAIQRIEKILGVPLFDRFKTGVQLTPSGQKLLNEGRTALEAWENMYRAAQSAVSVVEGRYTLGCHTAVALYTLPKFLKTLMMDYPRLEIVLKHGLSREVAADVISFKTDFGLVMNPVRHPDLVINYVCEDKVSCWKTSDCVEDVLIFDPALSQSQSLLKKIEKTLKIKRHLTSASLEVVANLAANGCGIGVLPARVAALYPNLVPVHKDLPWVLDRLALVYRADRSFTASARVIVDSISRAKF